MLNTLIAIGLFIYLKMNIYKAPSPPSLSNSYEFHKRFDEIMKGTR